MTFLLLLALHLSWAVAINGDDDIICNRADIIFVVDESGSVVSVLTFNNDATNEFYLNQWLTEAEILTALDSIVYNGGGTQIHAGLDFVMSNTLAPGNGERPNVPTVVVVFTDGYSDYDLASASAQALRDLGLTVIAVGIGGGVDLALMNSIASDPDSDHVFLVGGYHLLSTVQSKIEHTACDPCTKYGSHWRKSPVTASCYRFVNKEKNCEAASDWCRDKSTDSLEGQQYAMLVRIETQDENDWIHMMIQGSKGNRWIAARTNIENDGTATTYWSDCPTDYAHWTNWAPNEPSLYHKGRREECAYIIRKGPNAAKWNDVPGSKSLKFVCEIPLFEDKECTGLETISGSEDVLDACLLHEYYIGTCSWSFSYYLGGAPDEMTCEAPCHGYFRLYM
ncbi:hypothetical protein ScPMuIL_016847 [Solemya velum]